MAKNSVRDYSATNADNTDIQSIDISEGCSPAGINNALREVMVDLKNVSTGAVALETPSADQLNVDNLRLDGNTISSTDTNGDITLDPDGTGVVNVTGNVSVDGGTIKLDGNYPVGTGNVALGNTALDSNVSGSSNTAIGADSLTANTASNNTAVGYQAGLSNTTGAFNTFVGRLAGNSTTTGQRNTFVGQSSASANTTGYFQVAVGDNALLSNTSGIYNTALGKDALFSNTTASSSTTVGYRAGYTNTTGGVDAFGRDALYTNSTGIGNAAFGRTALNANTTGNHNTAMGAGASGIFGALQLNTTGSYNTAYGGQALASNTTANNNTAVGYQAGYSATTSGDNTFIGYQAGYSRTGTGNTIVGQYAGRDGTTGTDNTLVGRNSGYTITTGSNNTILGMYNGNQGGLDIRTSSNNIVLSDGDGNPRVVVNGSGQALIGATSNASTESLLVSSRSNGNRAITASGKYASSGSVNIQEWQRDGGGVRVAVQYDDSLSSQMLFYSPTGHTVVYSTTSDYRLKENVVDLTGATDRIQQLAPKRFNFIVDADKTVDGFLAHEVADIVPEAIVGTKDAIDEEGNPKYQGIDQAKLVPLLTAALQEALTKIDALETRIEALEAN